MSVSGILEAMSGVFGVGGYPKPSMLETSWPPEHGDAEGRMFLVH